MKKRDELIQALATNDSHKLQQLRLISQTCGIVVNTGGRHYTSDSNGEIFELLAEEYETLMSVEGSVIQVSTDEKTMMEVFKI